MLMSRLPRSPAQSEPISTATLPMSRSIDVTSGVWLPNERVSTKMDIVNPIPPRQATAMSILHVAREGISPMRSLMAMKLANEIPSGFPMRSPRKIPIPTPPSAASKLKTLK